jgi:hypothetical protein
MVLITVQEREEVSADNGKDGTEIWNTIKEVDPLCEL